MIKQSATRKVLSVMMLMTLFGTNALLSDPKPERISGNVNGSIAFAPDVIAPGVYAVSVTAEGALSHFGHTQLVWEGDLELNSELEPTPLAGLGWRLTIAQGSTIEGTLVWQAQTTLLPGVYMMTGTFQVGSGTDRYKGATGNGTIQGTVNVLTGSARIAVEGEVVRVK
jgi:hypothetical protein